MSRNVHTAVVLQGGGALAAYEYGVLKALTVTYLRLGKPGKLVVRAQVRKQGENLSVCEADLEQDDRPLVHAVATFAVLHR